LYQKWFYQKVSDAKNGVTRGSRKKDNIAFIRRVSPALLFSLIFFPAVGLGNSRSRAEVCRDCGWWEEDGFATVSLVIGLPLYHKQAFGKASNATDHVTHGSR